MIFGLANGTSWFQVTGTGPTAINKQYLFKWNMHHTTWIRVNYTLCIWNTLQKLNPETSSVLLSSCLPLNINGWRAQVNQHLFISWPISIYFLFRFLYSTSEVDYSRNWVPLIQSCRKELNKAGIYTVITPFQTIIHIIILKFTYWALQFPSFPVSPTST